MPALTLAELQAQLGGTLHGNAARSVSAAASLAAADETQLGFVASIKHLDAARASRAGILILHESLAQDLGRDALGVENPHASFARALNLLHPQPQPAMGIHASASVASDARLAPDVRVGAGAVIESGAQIGMGCIINAHSYIGPGVKLGAHSLLHPRATLLHGCVVGARAILHSGCVVGSDGFGLAWENATTEPHWHKVPQIGRVIVGDDVEIGANTTIDRGALDDTIIENGVKLDNLIHIAHNCRIGKHTAIAACAGIAGSTRIGAYCQIGGAAMIIGHLDICDRVTVSAGTFVAKDIRKPGVYTSVQPLMAHEDWKRNAAHLRHLDTLAGRIRALEAQLKDTP